MTIDMTRIVEAVIGLIGLVLSSWVIPLLRAKVSEARWKNAMFWVKLAVEAAEKIYKEEGMGDLKKKYVEEFLKEHNINLDEAQIDVAIEAAVLQIQEAAA